LLCVFGNVKTLKGFVGDEFLNSMLINFFI